MNKEAITIQDCLDMYEKKGQAVILENGQVIGFVKNQKKIQIFMPKQTLTRNKEVISQLEDLKEHCKEMVDKEDAEDIWTNDVEALDYAIKILQEKAH